MMIQQLDNNYSLISQYSHRSNKNIHYHVSTAESHGREVNPVCIFGLRKNISPKPTTFTTISFHQTFFPHTSVVF